MDYQGAFLQNSVKFPKGIEKITGKLYNNICLDEKRQTPNAYREPSVGERRRQAVFVSVFGASGESRGSTP